MLFTSPGRSCVADVQVNSVDFNVLSDNCTENTGVNCPYSPNPLIFLTHFASSWLKIDNQFNTISSRWCPGRQFITEYRARSRPELFISEIFAPCRDLIAAIIRSECQASTQLTVVVFKGCVGWYPEHLVLPDVVDAQGYLSRIRKGQGVFCSNIDLVIRCALEFIPAEIIAALVDKRLVLGIHDCRR